MARKENTKDLEVAPSEPKMCLLAYFANCYFVKMQHLYAPTGFITYICMLPNKKLTHHPWIEKTTKSKILRIYRLPRVVLAVAPPELSHPEKTTKLNASQPTYITANCKVN